MKKTFLFAILVFTTLSFLNPVSALEKVSIAFIDFEGNEVSNSLCQAMSDVARTVLVNSGRFTVTDRDRINAIMKEQAFQQSGATTREAAVRLGQMLNVEKLIFGSLSMTGSTYLLNVTLVDVQKAEVESGEMHKYSGMEDFLSEAVETVIKKLIDKIPLTGNVIKIDGESVMADLGRKQGIEPGFLMKITRKIDVLTDLNGKIIGIIEDDIAEGQVEAVGENWCKMAFETDESDKIMKGDYVRLSLESQKDKTDRKQKPEKKKPDKKKSKDEEEKEQPLVPPVF